MFFHSVIAQMHSMMKRKTTWIAFYIVLGFVLVNYWGNLSLYRGWDVSYLPHPAKISLLCSVSFTQVNGLFFELYPMFVILPAGFSLALDYEAKESIFIYTRVGGMNYYMGKLVASFLMPFIALCTPLLLEIIMNYISYPKEAIGEWVTSFSSYDYDTLSRYKNCLFGIFEGLLPYEGVLVGILRFGVVSGVLNMFTVAISTMKVKFKVLLFLPSYCLLYGLASLDLQGVSLPFQTNYIYYLYVFEYFMPKSLIAYLGVLLSVTLFSVIVMYYNGKREMLI